MGCLLVVFVVVFVFVSVLFFFLSFCVLCTWYVHVYNHTICNGSSGLLQ